MPDCGCEGDERDLDEVLVDPAPAEGEHDRQVTAELFAND
jgi:hypothetical protein